MAKLIQIEMKIFAQLLFNSLLKKTVGSIDRSLCFQLVMYIILLYFFISFQSAQYNQRDFSSIRS